jgi:hypothetical protein
MSSPSNGFDPESLLQRARAIAERCFPEGSVILTQLGVISNLEAVLAH